MYNPYGPQGNNQPPISPPGSPYGPVQGQPYPPGPSNPYYPPPGGPMQPYPPGQSNPYYPYPGGPIQPYPPAPPPKKKKGKAILIALPILLVVCSISGWFCANGDFTIGDGIRITGFLAEPRVQATATYTASHYPFGTDILFEDNLSTLSGKWKTSSDCTNQGGTLHVTEANGQAFYPCMSTYDPFHEASGKYTYEVTIKQMDAPAAGLVFRGKNDDQYYHFLLVYSDGTYGLSVYDKLDKAKPYQVIKSGKLQGQFSFPLRIGVVIIDKQSIGLYANGVELATVSDDDAGTTGELGVAVFNNEGKKTAWADFVSAKCWAHRNEW